MYMTRHNPEVTLRQMLGYAEEAVAISRGKSRHDLDIERLMNISLTRLKKILNIA